MKNHEIITANNDPHQSDFFEFHVHTNNSRRTVSFYFGDITRSLKNLENTTTTTKIHTPLNNTNHGDEEDDIDVPSNYEM